MDTHKSLIGIFLLPALLLVAALGIAVMALTGVLDTDRQSGFVQGEIDGDRIDISAKFTARVASEEVKEGQAVKAGDLVLTLDGSEMLPKVRQAQEALAQAKAALDKAHKGLRDEELSQLKSSHASAKAALTRAQSSYARLQALYKQRVISRDKFEESERALRQAKAAEETAKAALDEGLNGTRAEDIEQAQAQVKALEAQLEETLSIAKDLELKAPVSGEISKIVAKRGELAAAGYPLATMINLDDLWASAFLKEDQLREVRMGKELYAAVPALGEQKILFKIDYISPLGSYATWRATNNSGSYDLKTFEVRARPVEPAKGLRPGMSVIFSYPFEFKE